MAAVGDRDMADAMRYRILGPLELLDAEERSVALGGRSERVLLASLLIGSNRVVSRDRLIDSLWGEHPPVTAANTLQVHIMVDDAVKTLELVAARGGQIVRPIGADAPEITALFRDPAGNVLGIYQHSSSRNRSAG